MAALAACRASGVIMNWRMITAYLPFLLIGFDRIGLSMWPAVTKLQVARLNSSYIADTRHLFGEFQDIVM